VLQYCFNWHQLSVIAGVTFYRFYFRLFPGTIKGAQVIEFLRALRRQIKRKLLVIWDGLSAHRSRLVRDYLEQLDGSSPRFLPQRRSVAKVHWRSDGQISASTRSRQPRDAPHSYSPSNSPNRTHFCPSNRCSCSFRIG